MLAHALFLHGCQCHLRLWNEVRHPERATPLEPQAPEALRQGQEVCALARQRLEGERGQAVPVRPTLLAWADDDTWRLVEVNAAGGCQPQDDLDLALQAWVLEQAGQALRSAGVLTLNTAYVFDGQTLDLERLFKLHDRTGPVAAKAADIDLEVVTQQAVLARPEPPDVRPGRHCFEPDACPFHAHCTRGQVGPEHPLSELPRLSRATQEALEAAGCVSIEQIPEHVELTPLQARVRECVVADRAWVAPELGQALAALRHPIHTLNIETCTPLLPRHAGMRPLQQVPSQWSCHVEDGPGALRHFAFLPEDGTDPRERFAHSLLDVLGTQGSICTYAGFEAGVILALAEALPHLAEPLKALLPRLADLQELIRTHYYHPQCHGSYALGRVLSVLVPGLEFSTLAIRHGEQASMACLELAACGDTVRRAQLRQDLAAYGCLTTLAMVKVRQALASVHQLQSSWLILHQHRGLGR